ncbi:hypothetical protein [Chelativorans alearense]|uniref:hypothetical protein n=1 Tax=Chelativorans alearense TaxID=2681495 RepID=UPI0013D76575|nr:hypothetical protein [Chelativorans alearense]
MTEDWEVSPMGFSFYHSLVDDDPKIAAPALEALGRVAAGWSRLEHHLDALIIQVNKPQYSERLFEQHPVSFSKKLALLKKWFNNYPPLEKWQEDIRYLASRLKILSKEDAQKFLSRNVLLHAIPASYNAETETLTLHHLKFVGDQIHTRHIDVSLKQLSTFFDLVQMANHLLGLITQELFTEEGHAQLEGRQ